MNRTLAAFALAALAAPFCNAGSAAEAVIYELRSSDFGYVSPSPVIADGTGNLYGTIAESGIESSIATAYELSPPGPGRTAWRKTPLSEFPVAGAFSHSYKLTMDDAGNLYGVNQDLGYVYELARPTEKGGTWTLTNIHQGRPSGPVTWFRGQLYGTDAGPNYGVVFRLTPPRAGPGWKSTVLYAFQGGSDGFGPSDGLAVDGRGDLFGTAGTGAGRFCGLVYELLPSATGSVWTKVTLHTFEDNRDGCHPTGGVIRAGTTLYGTTFAGGVPKRGMKIEGFGTVFELKEMASGGYLQRVIHRFDGSDGSGPYGGLLSGGRGVLYGTTSAGGADGRGNVFQLTHPAAGQPWEFASLHDFTSTPDGANPFAGVVLGLGGALYGTTENGGAFGNGAVFQISHP